MAELTSISPDIPLCRCRSASSAPRQRLRDTFATAYLWLAALLGTPEPETSAPAENLVTYFAPPGAPLRIDADAPGNCPF